jgi:hypothetical protein
MEGSMATIEEEAELYPNAADEGPAWGLPQADTSPVNDWFRGIIALVLLVVVAAGLTALMWARLAGTIATNDDASTLVQIFVTPLLTLFGTAVGYYYGTQQSE